MKRFLLLAAGALLLTACETASEIDAAATGAAGSSASESSAASSSTSSSSGSGSDSSSGSSSSSSSSTSTSDSTSGSDSSLTYDTNPQTALIKVGDRVHFDYDSAELDDDSRTTLDRQVEFLNQNPSIMITVEGHCDERGTREYNLALGEKRASSVKDYLIASGVNSARISTVSYGKERPQVLGSNSAAWKMNRRSVTTIN
jgi:peptidoglycan-associated lipoprotein